MNPEIVLEFWFKELSPEEWWKKDDTIDGNIRKKFTPFMEVATQGELFSWRKTPNGRLAEILLLDQFPRNAFRGSARAFATDTMALLLAQEMVELELIEKLSPNRRAFALMPYMHSESGIVHNEAIKLFRKYNLEGNLDYELKHKAIIDQFGRYPHRNEYLGRISTSEEIEFIRTHPGF